MWEYYVTRNDAIPGIAMGHIMFFLALNVLEMMNFKTVLVGVGKWFGAIHTHCALPSGTHGVWFSCHLH